MQMKPAGENDPPPHPTPHACVPEILKESLLCKYDVLLYCLVLLALVKSEEKDSQKHNKIILDLLSL